MHSYLIKAVAKIHSDQTLASGAGTLICSYIHRLEPVLGVQNFDFNIFVFFRKINIFGALKILWILFGGHHKIGLVLGVISM